MTISEILKTPLSEIGLSHYASEYYDPVKAHEYYMKNRVLKGRKKSITNDESQNTSNSSANATSNNSSESSSKSAKTQTGISSTSSKSNSSSYEEEYERYMFTANQKIQTLQRRLGRLSKEARLLLQDEIYAEIDRLREENMNKKYELKAKYGKGGSGGSGSSYADITSAKYKEKYGS